MNLDIIKITSKHEEEIALVIGRQGLLDLENAFPNQYVYIPAQDPRQDMIDAIGRENTIALIKHYGCSDLWIPSGFRRQVRNQLIKDDHLDLLMRGTDTGTTLVQLAAKFRLKTRTIHKILSERTHARK